MGNSVLSDDNAEIVTVTSMENAEFIARHDPARVLREIDAKRRVLARHVLSPAEGDPERPWVNVNDCQYDGEPWPCPDVLDLAAPYADRPGHDAERWGL